MRIYVRILSTGSPYSTIPTISSKRTIPGLILIIVSIMSFRMLKIFEMQSTKTNLKFKAIEI